MSFKPWESISSLIIVPGKMHSFWTLIYAGMWFDNEPKFLYFLDSKRDWWDHYYAWVRGEERFPDETPAISNFTQLIGSSLLTCGLFPLLLMMNGLYHYVRRYWKIWDDTHGIDMAKMSIFPMLFLTNSAGIIALTLRFPVFSAMKASYFLSSLPAFAVFFSLGLIPCEKNKIFKWIFMIILGGLYALVSVHILHICWALL